MRNHIGAFALVLPLALAGVGSVLAAETAAAQCSVATLHGTYLFANQGVITTGTDKGPFAVAGSEVYDGQGNVRSVYTISMNGEITRRARVTGTYTVNANCISFVRYSDGSRYDQFLAPDGGTFVFIQVDPGTVTTGFELGGTARRVSD
jgi:hypothetical protein